MIIFLYGPDTYRSRAQLGQMIEKFRRERDPQGLNLVRFVADEETAAKIEEGLLASPFLAEKRMVVIEGLLVSKHKELVSSLLARVKDGKIPSDTIVIFWEGGAKPRTKDAKALLALLKKEKFAQEFAELEGRQLVAWIAREVQTKEGRISAAAATNLANLLAGSSWELHHVVNQLLSYADGREITPEDVALFVEESADDNIFNLVDAVVAGQTKKVFAMMQEQYKLGKDPGYILAMLIRQFRILLMMRDLHDRDELQNSSVAAKKLELHPFVVKKSLPLVKRLNMSELKTAYDRLLEIDIKTKTGQSDQSVLLDVFVSRQRA